MRLRSFYELEDLAQAELELLDRALVRVALLVSSDDDRVALRACREVLDRVLGRPKCAPNVVERDYEAEIESAHEKLAEKLERMAAARREEPSADSHAGE